VPEPQTAPEPEWFTKEQAIAFLNRSERRMLEIVQKRAIPTKEVRLPDRGLRKFYHAAELRAYQAEREALRVKAIPEPGKAVAKRETPAALQTLPAVIDKLFANGWFEEAMQRFAHPVRFEPDQYVTLREAAQYLRLTPTRLKEACDEGRLAFLWDGPPTKRVMMVRFGDLSSLRF
jgi:hypothetical protein